MRSFEFSISADHYQFLLLDERSGEDYSHFWSEDAVAKLIAIGNDAVGVMTAGNSVVPLWVGVYENRPAIDDDRDWDQIVECTLNIPSGTLVIMGATDYFPDALRIKLEPSSYRIRIYYGGITTGAENGDFYRIEIWKATDDTGVLFLKTRGA